MTALVRVATATLLLAVATAQTPPPSATVPPDPYSYKDGPNAALARAKCSACHSAEYVYTQPPLTKTAWRTEVLKMKNAYGAPIDDADVDALVDYLMSQNGNTDLPK